MTSKEALEKGKKRDGLPLNKICYVFTDKELKAIEKDLEILEILKRKINIGAEFDTWRQKYISTFYGNLTDEEKDKIVRWLDA